MFFWCQDDNLDASWGLGDSVWGADLPFMVVFPGLIFLKNLSRSPFLHRFHVPFLVPNSYALNQYFHVYTDHDIL